MKPYQAVQHTFSAPQKVDIVNTYLYVPSPCSASFATCYIVTHQLLLMQREKNLGVAS